MSHEFITTLLWVGYYMALAVWILLAFFIIIGLIKKRWDIVKRGSKYFINSSVFWLAYYFYLDLALIVRSPVLEPQLKAWVNEHVIGYLFISMVAVLILFGINLFFYNRVEKGKYKSDLLILAVFDIFILICGALIAGQEAYFGLLQELN